MTTQTLLALADHGDLAQLLSELSEYMHDRADADHDGDHFIANPEMRFERWIDAVRRALAAPQVEMVSDEMVVAAMQASDSYWDDESLMVPCETCKGSGKVAMGEDQEWCDCGGGGRVHVGIDSGAMRHALQAALNARAGGDAVGELIAAAIDVMPDGHRHGVRYFGNKWNRLGDALAALASQAVGVKDGR